MPSTFRIAFSPVRGWLALSLLALPWGSASHAQEEAGTEPARVFIGATLIPAGGAPPIVNGVLVVEGERIVALGEAGAVELPADATQVDLAGAYIMPALIDTHTHLSREREALIEDLRARAHWGVGAVLSLGQDEGEALLALRQESIPGAALYRSAGRGITAPEPGRSDIPHWVSSEEEVRAAVAEEAALGVDILKLWVDDRDGQYDKLSPALYGAAIEEAHARGLRVTAHIFSLDDAKGLLRAGVDAFAHGVRDTDVDDEFLDLVAARPALVLNPNLPDPGLERDLSWLEGHIPAAQFQQLQSANVERPQVREAYSIQARNLARMNDAGVHIVLGTDGNTPWGPHLELEDMVMAGLTPVQAIESATAEAAAFLQLDSGSLAAGKPADFIILEADPLEDIRNTRRLLGVWLRGQEVQR